MRRPGNLCARLRAGVPGARSRGADYPASRAHCRGRLRRATGSLVQSGRSRGDDPLPERGSRAPARCARRPPAVRVRRLARAARTDCRDDRRDRRDAQAAAQRRGIPRRTGGGRRAAVDAHGALRRLDDAGPGAGGRAGSRTERSAGADPAGRSSGAAGGRRSRRRHRDSNAAVARPRRLRRAQASGARVRQRALKCRALQPRGWRGRHQRIGRRPCG